MRSSLRLGIIGVGRFTRLWHLKYLRDIPQAQIVGLADPNMDNIRTACAEYELSGVQCFADHEEMLNELDLDAVIIASPHAYHSKQIRAALERRLHVLANKPLASSSAEIRELLQLAETNQRLLQVVYQRHLQPEYLFMHEYVGAGRLGEIMFCTAHISHSWLTRYQGEWRLERQVGGGGILTDTGRHLIDAVLWVTGQRPIALAAALEDYGLPFEVNAAVTLRFERSALGQLSVIGDSPWNHWWEAFNIWGSEGAITWTNNELLVMPKSAPAFHPGELPNGSTPEENFCKALIGAEQAVLPGEYDLQVTEFIEAVQRANATGQMIAYPQGSRT
jgi:predicted dehydrogenase